MAELWCSQEFPSVLSVSDWIAAGHQALDHVWPKELHKIKTAICHITMSHPCPGWCGSLGLNPKSPSLIVNVSQLSVQRRGKKQKLPLAVGNHPEALPEFQSPRTE